MIHYRQNDQSVVLTDCCMPVVRCANAQNKILHRIECTVENISYCSQSLWPQIILLSKIENGTDHILTLNSVLHTCSEMWIIATTWWNRYRIAHSNFVTFVWTQCVLSGCINRRSPALISEILHWGRPAASRGIKFYYCCIQMLVVCTFDQCVMTLQLPKVV